MAQSRPEAGFFNGGDRIWQGFFSAAEKGLAGKSRDRIAVRASIPPAGKIIQLLIGTDLSIILGHPEPSETPAKTSAAPVTSWR